MSSVSNFRGSLYALDILAQQVTSTVRNSGLCCCVPCHMCDITLSTLGSDVPMTNVFFVVSAFLLVNFRSKGNFSSCVVRKRLAVLNTSYIWNNDVIICILNLLSTRSRPNAVWTEKKKKKYTAIWFLPIAKLESLPLVFMSSHQGVTLGCKRLANQLDNHIHVWWTWLEANCEW